jgi:hypothetical protein
MAPKTWGIVQVFIGNVHMDESVFEPLPIEERYPEVNPVILHKQVSDFQDVVIDFLTASGYQDDIQYSLSFYSLVEMFIRIDKRRVYYQYFHQGVQFNERKQAALQAYWIIRFKPLQLHDTRYKYEECESTINEWLACYVVESMLKGAELEFQNVTTEESNSYTFFDRLQYSMRYQSHTIDSMMMVVEAMTPAIYELSFPSGEHLA